MTRLPNSEELDAIRAVLIEQIFRNDDLCFSDFVQDEKTPDIVSIIASLYNMLYLALTNTRYDYFFHHCNKIGYSCADDYFNSLIDKSNET